MNNNITPLEFLYSAFYYKEDVERMVLADTPSVYAEQFKQALFNAGFQVADFHYEVASQAIDAILHLSLCIISMKHYRIVEHSHNTQIFSHLLNTTTREISMNSPLLPYKSSYHLTHNTMITLLISVAIFINTHCIAFEDNSITCNTYTVEHYYQ